MIKLPVQTSKEYEHTTVVDRDGVLVAHCWMSRQVRSKGECVIVAAEIERALNAYSKLAGALEAIVKGNHRCNNPTQMMAWAQDLARTVLEDTKENRL